MKMTILANSPAAGISIVCNDSRNLYAMSGGKYYTVPDGRPCMGTDGRQLRAESRAAIAELMNEAKTARDALAAELERKIDEAAASRSVAPRKSFAEVLEEQFLAVLAEKSAGDMAKEVYPVVEKLVVEQFGLVPKMHKIEIANRPAREIRGVLHKDFDRVVSMVMDGEPVYLCGPAGTGKSYMAKQVADALNLDYWYTASVVDDIQLKGFIDANGRYHETQFYKAFTRGGVFLLDELDASNEETLTILNNALANGYFDFPIGRTEAHPDFHALASGNTFGTGADDVYTGRRQLDAASMNRFALISVDYDKEIELAMANGDRELVDFAREFRKAVEAVHTQCLCTYRDIKRLAKFTAYMSKADALRIGLIKGLASDDVRTIYAHMSGDNAWKNALTELF